MAAPSDAVPVDQLQEKQRGGWGKKKRKEGKKPNTIQAQQEGVRGEGKSSGKKEICVAEARRARRARSSRTAEQGRTCLAKCKLLERISQAWNEDVGGRRYGAAGWIRSVLRDNP